MHRDQTDALLSAIDAVLNRFLVESADGDPRPLRYNPVDYQTLKRIEDMPDSRATDIAQVLRLPPTTLQSALDRLVRMNYLEKRPHPDDGRAKVYRLSEDGVQLRKTIHAQDRANIEAMLSALSQTDQSQFLDLMAEIETHIRKL